MSSVPVPYAGALDTELCPRGKFTNIKKLGRETELELVVKVTTETDGDNLQATLRPSERQDLRE